VVVVSANGDGSPDQDAGLVTMLAEFGEIRAALQGGEPIPFGEEILGWLRGIASTCAARAGLAESPLQEAVEQETFLGLQVAVAMTARCLVAPEAVS
jgi:hypothetical protein